ncbi:sorbosone dehydrogenase family protein [Janibacter sp. YB324]|uniref:PQQ-dependent sugar dehydrogenase n=1 Tax=Janibacter sp. YB324 TaxID=2761047 RepID=UPI001628C5A7|nr:PQQ-dependent sugar dehydrogenase [Janibacter sp. YB324]QNF94826.1 PQQ-dependent sugar dehydrogenase [Janibacter sp. YB324]
MDRRTAPRAAALAAATALLVGCSGEATDRGTSGSGTTTSGAPPSSSSGSAPTDVVTDLDAPWSITIDDETTLVSERDSGRVLELTDDGGTREVGAVEGVSAGGEGGLLGLAVHDDYLYTYFTSADDNRVVRHELTGEPGSLGLGDAETILEGIPSASFHNGGRIAFGPDDMLYVTTGDAGETDRAQDPESLAGKILRLTPEGEVPEDNPFDDSLVWTLGHRNPQGIAWDDDGTMYASEFGQDTWDELNVIEAGDNYGWPTVEGTADDDRFTDPVQQWSPDDASPSGIAIDDGSIWIANLRGERLREVPLDDVTTSTEHLVGEHGRLRDVAVATDGSLWVLTNNTDGRGDPGDGDDRILRVDVVRKA